MAKGKARVSDSGTGSRKRSPVRSAAAANWNWVTSSMALMRQRPLMPPGSPWRAVGAQEAGPALGPGLAALADAGLGGPRLADGDPLAQTGLGLAEVVDVAVGKGCQPLVARIAEEPEGALARLLGGRPRGVPWRASSLARARMSAGV